MSAIFTKKWWHIIINFNLYTSVVEQEEGNKILYTVIGILIMIVVIGIIAYIFYEPIRDKIKEFREEKIEIIPTTTYNVFVLDAATGQGINADYVIYQETIERQRAKTTSDAIEAYTSAFNSSNYSIEAWAEDYYFNRTLCERENQQCRINLQKIGEYEAFVVTFIDGTGKMLLKIHNNSLFSPLACLQWNDNIKNIDFKEFNATIIPSIYLAEYDKCYQLSSNNMFGLFEYELFVRRDDFPIDDNNNFTISILDICPQHRNNAYEGCAPTKNIIGSIQTII